MVGLKDKMPDIQKTLDTVRFLQLRKVSISIRYITRHASLALGKEGIWDVAVAIR